MVTSNQPSSGQPGLPPGYHVFPLPPAGFNPKTAPAPELEKFGIIPRPDPRSELFEYWMRLFEPPVTFVDPKPKPVTAPPPTGPVPDIALLVQPGPDIPQGPILVAGSRFTTSENWSGGYIVPTHGKMVVQAGAKWRLPRLFRPKDDPGVPVPAEYQCSTWVGLDGQCLYLNSSLPQIGVIQSLPTAPSGAASSATAFCQWWDRQGPQSLIELTGLTLDAENEVIGSIWANTATSVIGYLRNIATDQLTIIGMGAPVVKLRGGTELQLNISGATAEWVLERPTELGTTTLYPFPCFDETEFDAWAAAAPEAGPPEGAPMDLRRAVLIGMYEMLVDPTRTAFISMPHRKGNAAFVVKHGGFGPK
jgi:hypothetical protein